MNNGNAQRRPFCISALLDQFSEGGTALCCSCIPWSCVLRTCWEPGQLLRDTALQHSSIIPFSGRNLSSWDAKILLRKPQHVNNMSMNVVVWTQNYSKKKGGPRLWFWFILSHPRPTGLQHSALYNTSSYRAVIPNCSSPHFVQILFSHLKSGMDFM